MYRSGKLEYKVFAKHADSCGLGEHHDVLGCATGYKANDYVLAAEFAYLLEAIDYCFLLNGRGVNVMLRKPVFPKGSEFSDYTLAKSPIRSRIVETRVDLPTPKDCGNAVFAD